MKGFHVLGVTQISDSYPNVKYRLVALRRLLGGAYFEYVMLLNKSNASPGFFSALSSGRLAFVWRLLIGHIKVLFYSLQHRADCVYVCYPGIFLAAWLGLPFMRKRYPVMYLDAFISLYDTIVYDRRILKEDSFLAKILYRLEKRAFEAATVVVVDTPENVQFYSELFGIPSDKFYAMPLCIPPLCANELKAKENSSGRLRCIFVGTFPIEFLVGNTEGVAKSRVPGLYRLCFPERLDRRRVLRPGLIREAKIKPAIRKSRLHFHRFFIQANRFFDAAHAA